jgi:hypothetical protein
MNCLKALGILRIINQQDASANNRVPHDLFVSRYPVALPEREILARLDRSRLDCPGAT